ncbi:lipoprotein signal peptidase [Betaproteobacteria bacterium]|nr:lipoprotein signal peptidase [Betaproteobacteria bacterium]GHU43643.1 lipoprotein signal peptidase [Betaproteobacteria bacterium]
MRKATRLFLLWLAAAALVVVADQASKLAVLAHFQLGERLPLTDFFNLVLVYNPGSAFSLLAGAGGWQKWLFTALALAISAWILRALWQQPEQKLQSAALSLIMGGAIGNVIDRLAYGAVVDFLDFYVASWHWPAFNIADSGICVGAVLLLLSGFKQSGANT